ERKLGFKDLSSLKKARIAAEREAQSMITQKQNSVERIREIDDRINVLNRQLKQDDYAKADERLYKKLIDKTISDLVCDDLNKYYKALDYAVTTFHRNKMEEIN